MYCILDISNQFLTNFTNFDQFWSRLVHQLATPIYWPLGFGYLRRFLAIFWWFLCGFGHFYPISDQFWPILDSIHAPATNSHLLTSWRRFLVIFLVIIDDICLVSDISNQFLINFDQFWSQLMHQLPTSIYWSLEGNILVIFFGDYWWFSSNFGYFSPIFDRFRSRLMHQLPTSIYWPL